MKFGQFLLQNRINEWKEFYLDYDLLKHILDPLAEQYKKVIQRYSHLYIQSTNGLSRNNLNESLLQLSVQEETQIQKHFEDQILAELEKVEFFYNQNISFYSKKLDKINVKLIINIF
jgi:hypothetical protein